VTPSLRIRRPLILAGAAAGALALLSPAGAAAGLAVVALAALALLEHTAARLRTLEEAARTAEGSGTPTRALELPADEAGRLGSAINSMSRGMQNRLMALEHERDQRDLVLSHVYDGVALLDGSGRVVHANQSFAGILGLPLAPERGVPLRDAVRLPDLDGLLEAAARSGVTEERELRFWAPGEKVVRVTATPLEAGDEHVLVLVLHDLSEAELVDRVRRDFVANVSHELKTPLTSLRGYAETLLDGGLNDVEHREGFVRVIRDQAERLQALVEDLLSLAELERPDARLRLEGFDLRGVVERQVALLRGRAEQAGIGLALVSGGPVRVVADRSRIEQVVANLLDNAVKYTERGGVTITLGTGEAHAWCEVADTGAGIPADDLSRVFERFYRVDKARAREKGGTGLGLSIVKHILALHEGNVSVQSEPGAGSTFRFELPLSGPHSAA